MTEAQLKAILETNSSSVEFRYRLWEEKPNLPFGVFYLSNTDDLIADGENYFNVNHYTIELYTEKKQPIVEQSIEAVLILNGIVYSKSETYISDEKMFEIIYEI